MSRHESADSISPHLNPLVRKHAESLLTGCFCFPAGLHRLKEEEHPAEEETRSENEEEDSEEDSVRAEPASREAPVWPALTKAQSRELRRWTRRDHGWFSDLLEA